MYSPLIALTSFDLPASCHHWGVARTLLCFYASTTPFISKEMPFSLTSGSEIRLDRILGQFSKFSLLQYLGEVLAKLSPKSSGHQPSSADLH